MVEETTLVDGSLFARHLAFPRDPAVPIDPAQRINPASNPNNAFFNDRCHKTDLLNQLLLYDRVVIPTKDMAIVSMLVGWLGYELVRQLLDAEAISFAHVSSVICYAGNGGGLRALTFTPNKDFGSDWWMETHYGSAERALELQIAMCPGVQADGRQALCDLAWARTQEVDIHDEQLFQESIAKPTYEDIVALPHLCDVLLKENDPSTNLAWLKGVEPNNVRVGAPEEPSDGIGLVLRVAEVHTELFLGEYLGQADVYTSRGAELLVKDRLARSQTTTPLKDQALSVMELYRVPDIGDAVTRGALDIDKFWSIRQSDRAARFRSWVHAQNAATERELEQAFVEGVAKTPMIEKLPVRLLRLALVKLADALFGAGVPAKIGDTVLARLIRGYNPKVFLDELRALPLDTPHEPRA